MMTDLDLPTNPDLISNLKKKKLVPARAPPMMTDLPTNHAASATNSPSSPKTNLKKKN
jgi:hypothetical protein